MGFVNNQKDYFFGAKDYISDGKIFICADGIILINLLPQKFRRLTTKYLMMIIITLKK